MAEFILRTLTGAFVRLYVDIGTTVKVAKEELAAQQQLATTKKLAATEQLLATTEQLVDKEQLLAQEQRLKEYLELWQPQNINIIFFGRSLSDEAVLTKDMLLEGLHVIFKRGAASAYSNPRDWNDFPLEFKQMFSEITQSLRHEHNPHPSSEAYYNSLNPMQKRNLYAQFAAGHPLKEMDYNRHSFSASSTTMEGSSSAAAVTHGESSASSRGPIGFFRKVFGKKEQQSDSAAGTTTIPKKK